MTQTPLRLLIVDDEPLAVERLQILAGQLQPVQIIGTASDGLSALRMVEKHAPDMILCDIAMPGLDGIAVAHALERLDQPPAVIFATAFDHYAVAAFDVAAVDYLLKPVSLDRLSKAFTRAREWQQKQQAEPVNSPWISEFWVQNRGEMLRLDSAQVDLIEAERDYMRLHVGARSWLIHQTIKSLEARLDPEKFLRIHRSKIIRRASICGLRHHGDGAWSVDMGDGGLHRIGRTYLQDVKSIMQRG